LIREQGEAALRLLFLDLKGLSVDDPNSALRSVTGYDLPSWNRRWQQSLLQSSFGLVMAAPGAAPPRGFDPMDLARRARLGELLIGAGFGAELAPVLRPGVAGREPIFRFCQGRAELARHDPEQAAQRLGAETEIDAVYGPWFGLKGRLLEKTDAKAAERSFALGLASDPLAEEVACRGRFSIGQDLDDPSFLAAAGGADASAWLALCEAARKRPRD
jgi:hypothetical protein